MVNSYEPVASAYTSRQRAVCATLGLASTLSVSTSAVMANAPMPTGGHSTWGAHTTLPAGQAYNATAAGWSTGTPGHVSSFARPQSDNPTQALMQSVFQPYHQANHALIGNAALAGGGLSNDLNLASSKQLFLAENLANFRDLTILVGGTREFITAGTRLTAAEVVAAQQVLNGGQQTLRLNSSGAAIGGTVVFNNSMVTALDASVGGAMGSITISQGVKVVDTVSNLNFTGNLSNYGSLQTASYAPGNVDTISANNIFNAGSGVMGSYSGAIGGLYSADAIFNAMSSFSNYGTVSSAGNLTINAPVVINVAKNARNGVISAGQDVNINSAAISNAGVISALHGNVNVSNNAGLLVQNIDGTINAKQGNINFNANNADINILGGNFYSNNVNVKAGEASALLSADKISGLVNASGNNVHLYAGQSDLNLGDIDCAGDPTFASKGNVTINGSIAPTNGADLAIIAGGNIISAAGSQINTTKTGGGDGGNLLMVAGANIISGDGVTTPVVIQDSANTGKGSTAGGLIDLTGGNGGSGAVTKITTAGSGAGATAGSITMVAYAGAAAKSGTITTPSAVTIDASVDQPDGTAGDINIIAGAKSGDSITTGSLSGKDVTLSTYTPTAGGGVTVSTGGTITAGAFSTGAGPNASNIVIQQDMFAVGNVTLTAGGAISTFGISAMGRGAQPAQASLDGEAGHAITIEAGGLVQTGYLNASGGGGAGAGSIDVGADGGAGGDGGTISVTSLNDSVMIYSTINVSGGGGGGGAGGSETYAASQGGAGGIAGTVTLTAAKDVFVQDKIYAYDGGAGGAGGDETAAGVGGGGGGGNAYGGAGGGGGGGLGDGTHTPVFAAGGGGGYSPLNAAGGGGGGSFDGGTDTYGGGGGWLFGGFGGFGDVNGGNAFFSAGGAGGGTVGPPAAAGGVGATTITTAGGGGHTTKTGAGIGLTGGLPVVVTASGSLDITVGGDAYGNTPGSGKPIATEVAQISIAGTTAASTANILNTSGIALDVNGATLGSTGGVTIATGPNANLTTSDGTINITGAVDGVTGGTIVLTTGGSAKGNNDININYIVGNGAGTATITANNGNITALSPGLIDSTSANLIATGNIDVETNVTNLRFSSTSGTVNVLQGANPLNIGISSANGKAITVVSGDQINTTGLITNTGGKVSLEGGAGIKLGASIDTGTTGSIELISDNDDILSTAKANILTGASVSLTAINSAGTAAIPISTKTPSIIASTGNDLYVSDSTTTTLKVNGTFSSSGTMSVASVATTLNIVEAPYSTVIITDTGTSANVLLNSTNNASAQFGDGNGTFTVNTTGNINANDSTGGIQGTVVSLTAGNAIGNLNPVLVNSPALTLKASNGGVRVTDLQGATVSGSATSAFTIVDLESGGIGLIVNGVISAPTISLDTTTGGGTDDININAALGTATTANLTLKSGGSIFSSSAGAIQGVVQTITAANDVTLDGTVATTNQVTITATGGTATLNNTVTGTGAGAAVTIKGGATTGDAIVVAGAISADAIILTGTATGGGIQIGANVGTLAGTSTNTVTAKGSITSTGTGAIAGSTVVIKATNGGDVGTLALPVLTAAKTLTANSTAGSVFVSQAGNLSLGASAAAQDFNLKTTSGTLTTTAAISATSGNLTLASAGAMTTGAAVTATNGTASLSAGGLMTLNGAVSGQNVSLTTTSGNMVEGVGGSITATKAVAINIAGTATLTLSTPSLSITSSQTGSSADITDTSNSLLTITGAAVGSAGTLKVTTGGTNGSIDVTGAISGSALTLITNGSGANNINITGAGVFNGGSVFLTGLGNITSATAANIINGASATLKTTGGGINVNTNVNSLSLSSTAASSVTQGTKALDILASTFGGATGSVTAGGQVNVKGAVTNGNGAFSISGTGIDIASTIGAGTGSITLTATTGSITDSTSSALTAKTVNLVAASGSVGTSTKAVFTNATTVNATSSGTGNVFVNDANTGAFTFNAPSTSTGTLSLTSASTGTLKLANASYSTVTINGAGAVQFGTASVIGDGTGAVTITAAGNIDGADNTNLLKGTTVSLTSTNGSIGSVFAPNITAPTLVLNASKGSVNATDSVAATSVTGSALTSFTLVDAATTGNGIVVDSPISAATINLKTSGASSIQVNGALGSGSGTVNLTSGADITLASAASVSATTISLVAANNVTAGGALSGNSITVTATGGTATISKTITGTGVGSTVDIKGGATSGTAVSLGGAVTADTISATSTSNGDVLVSGAVSGLSSAPATSVTFNSGNDLKLTSAATVNAVTMGLTATNNLQADGKLTGTSITAVATKGTATINGAITATGVGNFVTVKGGAASGNAVTLGSTVIGTTINIDSTSSGGDILVSGALGTSGSPSTLVAVTSKGSLTFGAAGAVNSDTITLKAANDVTAGGTLTGKTISVTATSGKANISKGITATGTGSSVAISGGANDPAAVSIGGAIGGDTITITGTGAGSGVTLAAGVGTSTTTSTTITANGAISGSAASTVSGATVALTSTNSDIGSTTQAILTKASSTLSANASKGSAYISQAGNVSLANSSADNTFTLTSTSGTLDVTGTIKTGSGPISLSAAGTLTAAGAISGGTSVTLKATGTSGAIVANGKLTGTAVSLNAATTINQGAASTIIAPTVTLNSTGATTLGGSIDGVDTSITAAGLTTNSGSTIAGADINTINLNITGATNLSGDITAANATLTSNTSGAHSQTGAISTKVATIAAATFSNVGALNGTTSFAVTVSGSGASALTNNAGGSIGGGAVSLVNTSKTANTITNAGTLSGTTSVTVDNSAAAAGGTITNSATGTINAPIVTLNSATVNNLNTINAGTVYNIGNASGDLTITGNTGSFTSNNGATLNLSAKGNIVAGSGANNPLSALNKLHTYTVTAGGTFSSPLTGISVIEDGSGNGGTISITASNRLFNNGTAVAPFTLNAPGTTGNGGTVILNLSGTATTGLVIGSAAGQYSINVAGSNGGTVNVTTPGALTVNTAALITNATNNNAAATGANISLSGTKSVLIVGNLDTHFGAGQYGDITIASGSTSAFTIDPSIAGLINGQTGITAGQGISGKTVTISDTAGVTVALNTVLSGSNAVIINGNTLTNNGTVNTKNLTIAATGTATLTASNGIYSKLDTLTVSSKTGGINLVGGVGKLPQANTINLNALAGAVNFGKVPTSLTADVDASGNGGTININAKTLTSAALTLSAAATTGAGGTININLSGTTAIKFDSKTITLDVTNAAGKAGGTVSVVDNANVTVDANFFKLGSNFLAGNAANLTLSGKTVHVSNAKSIDNGLKNLTIVSSAASYTVQGASSTGNGFSGGNTTVSAENLSITNNGGTIIKGTSTSVNATNVLTLKAKTDIGQSTKLLVINAPTASLIAGGSLYVNDTAATTTFTNLQALTTLQLTALNVTAPSTLNAKTLNLSVGSINAFGTNATTITAKAATGDLSITDAATAAVTLNAIEATGGNVSITTAGPLTAKSTVKAETAGKSVTLQSGGLLATKGAITAGTNVSLTATGVKGAISQGANITAGTAINLTAQGTGTTGTIVDAASSTYLASAPTVNLSTNGANIGTTAAAFRTGAAGNITVNINTGTTGAVNVTNKDTLTTGGTVTLGSMNVGSLKFTATNTTSTNAGTLKVSDILASTGAVLLISTEQNLSVNPGANISTVNGNITLQNTHVGSTLPTITIGAGATIHGSTPGTNKAAGNVFVVLGTAVPTSATVRPGIIPTPAPILGGTTTNLVTYGTTSNLNGSITTLGNNIHFNSLNRNLAFTTGPATNTKAQIIVGDNVTITADPPELSAIASVAARNVMTMNAAAAGSITSSPAMTVSATAIPQTVTLAAPTNTLNPSTIFNVATVPTLYNGLTAGISDSTVVSAGNRLVGGVSTTQRLSGTGSTMRNGVEYQALDRGATLLAPDHNTVVTTEYGPVSVAAGSVVMLVHFGDGLAVYDLHDSRRGAVVVGEGPQGLSLIPGRSAVLTRKAVQEFGEINPAPFVGYRQVAKAADRAEMKLFHAEFEIMSLMRAIKPLNEMMASDKPATRKTMSNVLKTAAILWQLGQGNRPFKTYVAPQKLAYDATTNK